MKKVKIFLASSIEDLREDRLQVGDFFRQLNEIYLDSGVHFSLIKCEDYDNSLAAVKMNDKWCFVDETGTVVLKTDYDYATSFSAGFAAVQKNGKWGYIGMDGAECIDCCFEDADPFSMYGSAFVLTEEGHWKILKLYMYNHD